VTHSVRWQAHYHCSGTGHVYQNRFKAFPIEADEADEADEHLYRVIRYVERNPLWAGPKHKGRRPAGNATPTRASAGGRQASIRMEDLASLKQLVDRLGASRISELTYVLGD
jgi:hypothetical protein